MIIIEQFQNTAIKLEAATAAYMLAKAQHAERIESVRLARNRASIAADKITTATRELTELKAKQGQQVLDGLDSADTRHKVRDIQSHIEGLESARAVLERQANEADALEARNFTLGHAEQDYHDCVFNDLVARYAAIVGPALPLAREIRRQAGHHQFGEVHVFPSALLETAKAHVGRYKLHDDGSLTVQV